MRAGIIPDVEEIVYRAKVLVAEVIVIREASETGEIVVLVVVGHRFELGCCGESKD